MTKHAAVAFAEGLSISYGDAGVRVSCLCPMVVATATGAAAVVNAGDVLQPDDVAAVVMRAVADERFLTLPHEDVLPMYRQKGSDYDRWLRGMRRDQATLLDVSSTSITAVGGGPALATVLLHQGCSRTRIPTTRVLQTPRP